MKNVKYNLSKTVLGEMENTHKTTFDQVRLYSRKERQNLLDLFFNLTELTRHAEGNSERMTILDHIFRCVSIHINEPVFTTMINVNEDALNVLSELKSWYCLGAPGSAKRELSALYPKWSYLIPLLQRNINEVHERNNLELKFDVAPRRLRA